MFIYIYIYIHIYIYIKRLYIYIIHINLSILGIMVKNMHSQFNNIHFCTDKEVTCTNRKNGWFKSLISEAHHTAMSTITDHSSLSLIYNYRPMVTIIYSYLDQRGVRVSGRR